MPPFKARHPNGSVRVFSGADGSELLRMLATDEVPDPPSEDNFGYSVAAAGDVNGDGFDDVIIGTESIDADWRGPGGFAQVRSGADGSVLRTFLLDDDVFDVFVSVDGIGDVNDDGFADVIVASRDRNSADAFLRIYSGADGSKLLERLYPNLGATRVTVSDAGDVNADGHRDFIVGVSSWPSGWDSRRCWSRTRRARPTWMATLRWTWMTCCNCWANGEHAPPARKTWMAMARWAWMTCWD